jgi:hypothetical protein
MEDFHHAQVGVCCTAALLLLLVLARLLCNLFAAVSTHLPACLPACSLKQSPTAGNQ